MRATTLPAASMETIWLVPAKPAAEGRVARASWTADSRSKVQGSPGRIGRGAARSRRMPCALDAANSRLAGAPAGPRPGAGGRRRRGPMEADALCPRRGELAARERAGGTRAEVGVGVVLHVVDEGVTDRL